MCVCVLLDKSSSKITIAVVAGQHAYTLRSECETVSYFQINLCDKTPPSPLAIFGTDSLFPLPEDGTAPKRRGFQRH
jgi:hypothetical protein